MGMDTIEGLGPGPAMIYIAVAHEVGSPPDGIILAVDVGEGNYGEIVLSRDQAIMLVAAIQKRIDHDA